MNDNKDCDSKASHDQSSGGLAMFRGAHYQTRVTFWWLAQVLAQTPLGRVYDLPDSAYATRISCETAESVDDIRIDLSDGSCLLGQCKKTLRRDKRPQSEFGKVFRQFAQQAGGLPSATEEQRFVLFYETHSRPLEVLERLLDRYRGLQKGRPFDDAARSDEEHQSVEYVEEVLDNIYSLPELNCVSGQREELLRHAHIRPLDVSPGRAHELELFRTIRDGILSDSDQVDLVSRALRDKADDLNENGGSIDRAELRVRLRKLEVDLKDSPSFRVDLKSLDDWSSDNVKAAEADDNNRLCLGGQSVTIKRPVVGRMIEKLSTTSFLVVGEAGVGKTGCLLELAKELQKSGKRVWYCVPNSSNRSIQTIRNDIGLRHSWYQVLSEVAAGKPTVLIIDGLDNLRDRQASEAYRDLLNLAMDSELRVVASIRSFDLLNSPDLKRNFRTDQKNADDPYQDQTFRDVRHISISQLEQSEIDQVCKSFSQVSDVLLSSSQLTGVCSNLFYLGLLCQLLDSGSTSEKLTEIGSRAELFDLWWQQRIESHPRSLENRRSLGKIVEAMVEQRSLSVSYEQWDTEDRDYLFSSGVLRHSSPEPGRLQQPNTVQFCHPFLFDHAAMKLFVEPRQSSLASELENIVNWGLFLRPSVVLFFRYAWSKGRQDYWNQVSQLEDSSAMVFHKMPAYLVVASESTELKDLQPLLDPTLCVNQVDFVQEIVSSARYYSLTGLFSSGSGDCWLELANELIGTCNHRLIHAARIILACAAENLTGLSVTGKSLLNECSRRLFDHYDQTPGMERDASGPIKWVCQTIDMAPKASSELIKKLLEPNRVRKTGYMDLQPLGWQISDIWQNDPDLAVDVYQAVFSFSEEEESETALKDSAILRLTSTRKQDYQGVRYSLSSRFGAFLSAHPAEATVALCKVLKVQWERDPESKGSIRTEKFFWDDEQCHIIQETAISWFDDPSPDDDEGQMLASWGNYLSTLAQDPEAGGPKWDTIKTVLCSEHVTARLWRELLKAATSSAEFFASRIYGLLKVPSVVFGAGLRVPAARCLKSISAHVERELIDQIQVAALEADESTMPGTDDQLPRQWMAERRARVICAIPPKFRTREAAAFLSACDPELVEILEEPDRTDDELIARWSTEPNGGIQPEGKRESDVALNAELEFLSTLSGEDVNEANISYILSRIEGIERAAEQDPERWIFRGHSAEDWCMYAFCQIAKSKIRGQAFPLEYVYSVFSRRLLDHCDEPSIDDLERIDCLIMIEPPDPLVLAAEGLLCLVTRETVLSQEWRDRVQTVARHPHPKVRLQFVEAFAGLADSHPQIVMVTVEGWIQDACELPVWLHLTSMVVLTPLLWIIREIDNARTDKLVAQFLDCVRLRGTPKLRRGCGELMFVYHVVLQAELDSQPISAIIDSVTDNFHEIRGLVAKAAEWVFEPVTSGLSPDDAYQRALDLLSDCLSTIEEHLQSYLSDRRVAEGAMSEHSEPEWVREVVGSFERAAIAFSRAARKSVQDSEFSLKQMDESDFQTWWNRVEPALKLLLKEPYPSVAYPLILGLQELTKISPDMTLMWLARITRASEEFGITLESSAVKHTFEILGTLLADAVVDLGSDETLAYFVDISERYLRAGWPRAFEFVTRLEGIFR